MRWIISFIVVMSLCVTPAPIVVPPRELPFDPNESPAVMGYFEEWLDKEINDGRFDVTAWTETLIVDSNLVEVGIMSVVQDVNDPNLYYHYFSWRFTPRKAGLVYDDITVTDPTDPNLFDKRRIVFFIKNRAPVITGCRRGIEVE